MSIPGPALLPSGPDHLKIIFVFYTIILQHAKWGGFKPLLRGRSLFQDPRPVMAEFLKERNFNARTLVSALNIAYFAIDELARVRISLVYCENF